MSWFRQFFRKRSGGLLPPPRSEAVAIVRVELAELSPAPKHVLGQSAYLAIVLFENLARAVIDSPSTGAKLRLTPVLSNMLQIHRNIVDELQRWHQDPVEEMELFREKLEEFQRRTNGNDWYETLLTCYLTSGFLLDFFAGLAAGLPDQLDNRLVAILQSDITEEVVGGELSRVIENDPVLSSRLALWGRRLIGDTMLVARSAIERYDKPHSVDRMDPVLTELIATHTRRMDALGLTA